MVFNAMENVSTLRTNQGNTSQNEEDPRMLATAYIMLKIGSGINQVYFPVLVPVGVIGNILSRLVMMQPNNRHMSFSAYISALAVSDTIVLINAFPRYLNQVHDVDMKPNQFWYCSVVVMIVLGSIQCSTYLIIAMTFERFYSIIKPHKAASFNTLKRAKITIAVTYVFSFSYNMPYLFIGDTNGRTCIPNRLASENVFGAIYYWLTEIIGFILPFISLLSMNSVIIHTLRQRSQINLTYPEGQGHIEGQKSKHRHSDRQVFTMLLLVTFGFLILTIPGKVLIFHLNFYTRYSPHYFAGLHLLDQLGEKTLYTNHGINFFLYVISGQKFRTYLRNLFTLKRTVRDYFAGSSVKVISSFNSSTNE